MYNVEKRASIGAPRPLRAGDGIPPSMAYMMNKRSLMNMFQRRGFRSVNTIGEPVDYKPTRLTKTPFVVYDKRSKNIESLNSPETSSGPSKRSDYYYI